MKALLALAAFAFLLAGCNGGGNEGVTPPQDDDGDYMVHMTAANRFDPAHAKVPVGATVVWMHDGGAPHDVQGDGFSSGSVGGMREGDDYEHTFDAAGTFEYVCHVHEGSGMKGTITVA